ncbi:unnamed protein product [Kuraishia capsulata CBS 1993]|uniref:Peptidase A1 domain-containing protein n=1 Tax=Kuraishia capsulata CBS 1993 TaxID=1382522 RepID=W6MH15_9ASCO|nr:uncharacterized protein KUCA_T00000895001 [Kuraishia capsulata CBS 1993]CDK24928.1 unnamed protein product [Kuraishia capsulata CBS 1993]
MRLYHKASAVLACLGTALAFEPLVPGFIKNNHGESVAKLTEISSSRSAAVSLKEQTVLGASNSSSDVTVTLGTGIQLLETDSEQNSFFLNVTVGDESVPLLLDTGSPYLWVYASDCESDACENKTTLSLPSDDKTTSTFSLAYTSGTASGKIATEDVTVAGLTAEDFNIGYASTVPSIFENYPFSGVLGLPSDNSSSASLENVITALRQQGSISESTFSLILGNLTVETAGAGLLIIGQDLEELYSGDFYTVDVIQNSASYWKIQVDGLFVDDDAVKAKNASSKLSGNAILDSGTTGIILSLADAQYLHSYFDNSISDGNSFAILCNSTKEISFEIGGHNWTLTSSDYLGSAYSSESDYYGYCISNIQGLDVTSEKLWILGGLFLKKVYSRFDYGNQQVGLAERYYNINVVSESTTAAAAAQASTATQTTSTLQTITTSTKSSSSSSSSVSSSSSTNGNSTTSSTQAQNSAPSTQPFRYAFVLIPVIALILI